MDRGESQFIEGCFLPVDISGGQVRPDATPLIRFESSDEEDNDIKDKEGLSSEPEVCVFLQGLYLITGVTHTGTVFCWEPRHLRPNVREKKKPSQSVLFVSFRVSAKLQERGKKQRHVSYPSTSVLLICVFNLSLPQKLTETPIKRFSRSSENINSGVSFRRVSMLQISI